MNRIRVAVIATVVAGLFALAACGADGTGPDATIEGTFALVEANGETLPVVVYDSVWADTLGNEFLIEALVKQGRLDLAAGGYTLELIFDVTQDGEILIAGEEVSESGSYAVDDGRIRFTPSSGDPVDGTIDGDEIEMSASDPEYGSYTLTFRK